MTEVTCNCGLVRAAKVINNVDATPAFTYMALGTGSTPPVNTDTALTTETSATGLARAAATCSYEASYKSKWVHSFTNTSGGTVGVREWGIHNKAAAEANDILMHGVYAADKNIENNETLQLTITATLS